MKMIRMLLMGGRNDVHFLYHGPILFCLLESVTHCIVTQMLHSFCPPYQDKDVVFP